MATSTLGSGTLVLAGTTSGTTTVTATAVAGTTTLTLPAATDTLVGKATTDTLTNKTLTSATLTGVATFDAGTAALPAITTTGDTNTGIFFPAADTIAFSEGGAEVARFDSGSRLLVGLTSSIASNGIAQIGGNADTRLIIDGSSTQGIFFTKSGADNGTYRVDASGNHNWFVAGAATANMTLDASGNLLVGTTSGSNKLTVVNSASFAAAINSQNTRNVSGDFAFATTLGSNCSNTSSYHIISSTGGADKFYVFGNGNVVNTNNSYGPLSDVKLKENIVDATPKLQDLMRVRIVNYNLKAELGYESHKQIGVVAQELEQVFAGLVDEMPDKDAEGNDLGTTTKSVKMSVFTPMLIKAIQEQQALITALTARITALEGA